MAYKFTGRVVGGRTEAKTRQESFVRNLKQVLELLPGNLKRVAAELGLPYKWLRRMVSSGSSRSDKRSGEHLAIIAKHFCLPSVDDLWRSGLFCWLLQAPEGERFRQEFAAQIKSLCRQEAQRADRLVDEQSQFDYRRLNAMLALHPQVGVLQGAVGTEEGPLTWAELSQCLNEIGFPGVISEIERWRRGERLDAAQQTKLKTGTHDAVP